ncbi:hypothetical protein RND81_12G109800 [Saponaria officinalis]|uniref:AAA+ ATPase domain-containing protein n=1 Tax=Saponaria officinalis TaxID=3572 RepID=A0AAW1H939_SAPOF
MEQKSFLLSALGVGVGVGVGIGLASGQTVGKWVGSNSSLDTISSENIELELLKLVVNGKEFNVTFDEFPYYLSEQTRVLLTSAAYVHLKHAEVSKFTRNLSPGSRAILLSGPAELYQQMLAKALAHNFDAKLLLLDVADFSIKMQNKYGCNKKEPGMTRSISEATLGRVSSLLGSMSSSMLPPKDLPRVKRANWSFDEKLFLQALYKVLVLTSDRHPIILYVRDIERLLLKSDRLYNLFSKLLNKLTGSILVLGSRMLDANADFVEVDERLTKLFPYNIDIRAPDDEANLAKWNAKLDEDMKMIQFQDTRNHIAEVLAANDVVCDDLSSICHSDTITLSNHIDEIVMSAISYHLMNNKEPVYRNGKLVISANSLSHGLSIFQEGKKSGKPKMETNGETSKEVQDSAAVKPESKPETAAAENKGELDKSTPLPKNAETPAPVKEVPPDNEFEKRIRPEVIPANEVGVTFADIGALDDIKESLQELVMLPLRRPDLFKGGLLKPCRGILLFGPPGTGKTMLAKAIANEAGASFINVSMSTITSKWFGEDEKNVRALFTLAAKVAPTIIFVDEVDSMLGQRTRVGEHEAMRKIKNEFMTHWDGLLSKAGEQILVLAATNRPFDLDEAIIRRFERRIMVGLPAIENREKILKTLLSKEKAEEMDFKELATMTEGYTGSDLKNLCVTAAYRPVRELIQRERKKDLERKKKAQENVDSGNNSTEAKEEGKPEELIVLRPLNMEDMKQAKNQVAASFASEGAVMNELKQWNELYGEGGTRKKQQLSYFL